MQYGYVVYYRTDYSDCPDDAVAIALSGNSVRQVVENHFLFKNGVYQYDKNGWNGNNYKSGGIEFYAVKMEVVQ